MKNVFYATWICKIGGLETFFYNLVKTHPYPKWDITIYCQKCDPEQYLRLMKYCNVKFYKPGEKIKCDTFWCNFNKEILDTGDVEAKHINLVLHGDYGLSIAQGNNEFKNLPIHPKVEQYYGVSKAVCDSWKKTTGFTAKLIYNPIVIEENELPLRFISATRLTKEKGYERMVKLADELDKAGVKYEWDVFTTGKVSDNRFNLRKPTLEITSRFKHYDALIQLSSNEGYCYSIIECLCLGKPVIATKLSIVSELGLNDSNSILLDFDMKNIPIERIKNIRDIKFEYKPMKSNWDDNLVKGESQEEKIIVKTKRVKATKFCREFRGIGIYINDIDCVPKEGQVFEILEPRFKELNSKYEQPLFEEV